MTESNSCLSLAVAAMGCPGVITHMLASFQEAAGEERRLAKSLNVLEQRLQSSTYLVGQAISLADIVLVCDLAPAFSKVLPSSHSPRCLT